MPFFVTENLVSISEDGFFDIPWNLYVSNRSYGTDLAYHPTTINQSSDYSTCSVGHAVLCLKLLGLSFTYCPHTVVIVGISLLLCSLHAVNYTCHTVYCVLFLLIPSPYCLSSASWSSVGKTLIFKVITRQQYCFFHFTSPLLLPPRPVTSCASRTAWHNIPKAQSVYH